MRSGLLFPTILIAVIVFIVPSTTHAAGIPFLGPIIPPEDSVCPASWGMVLPVVNNIIRFLITIVIVFVAPIMTAWAGFLYVANPINPSYIGRAYKILLHTIMGVIIALSGWLIVDMIMAVLYNASEPTGTKSGVLGNWYSIISSGGMDRCIDLEGSLNQIGNISRVTGVSVDGGKFLTLPTNGECTPSKLMSATLGTPYALTPQQADTLSCIAVAESSCGTNITGAKQADGTPTSANGMFQILLGADDNCHSLNIPSCTAAAIKSGYAITSENLQCSNAFSGGRVKPGMEALANACKAAAANLECNAQAAGCLVKKKPTFSDWTGSGDGYAHATQRNCVSQYSKS